MCYERVAVSPTHCSNFTRAWGSGRNRHCQLKICSPSLMHALNVWKMRLGKRSEESVQKDLSLQLKSNQHALLSPCDLSVTCCCHSSSEENTTHRDTGPTQSDTLSDFSLSLLTFLFFSIHQLQFYPVLLFFSFSLFLSPLALSYINKWNSGQWKCHWASALQCCLCREAGRSNVF